MLDPYDPSTYTDQQLIDLFNEAKLDLAKAAEDEPESEWHQACFAAVIMVSQEASKRGLKLTTVH